MSAQLDLQSIFFPYLHRHLNSQNTSKAIQQTAKYISTDPTFNNTDYKSCPAFKPQLPKHSVYGTHLERQYVLSCRRHYCRCPPRLTPDGSIKKCMRLPFAASQLFSGRDAIYPNTGEAAEHVVQEFIYGRSGSALTTQKRQLKRRMKNYN